MIHIYGILISVSILSCILVAEKLAGDKKLVWDTALWTVIGGLIGARVYHVFSILPFYINSPLKIFEFWNGGLGIIGAIAGGITGSIIYLKINKKEILPILDIFSVVVPLGQSIGRWGNFYNQELYGIETKLPWGLLIENKYYHPIFLYESLLCLALFFTGLKLYTKYKDKFNKGFFLILYLAGYSLIRFFMEFLRADSWKVAGLNVSQTISILLLLSSILVVKNFIKGKVRK